MLTLSDMSEDLEVKTPAGNYSIILPTYNEHDNLPICIYLIDEVFKSNDIQYEVIVVDDNSPDGTANVARTLRKRYPSIRLLCRAGKLGLGTAYAAGLEYARGEFVILMDCDLSHHPKFISEMISLQEKKNVSHNFNSSYKVNFFSMILLLVLVMLLAEEYMDGIGRGR